MFDETRLNRFGFVLAAFLCLAGTSAAAAGTLVVTNGDDSGAGSLRDAVAAAVSGDTIRFATGVTEVVLTNGQITLNKSLTVNGAFVTVRRDPGAWEFRIFEVTGGVNVTINDLSISGGYTHNNGGGILNSGGLTLTGCTVSGNRGLADDFSRFGYGGAIYHAGAGLTIIRSTISGNEAGKLGGAIYINSGPAWITGSTVAANSAKTNWGGAIRNLGYLFLNSSIVADNTGNSPADLLGDVDQGDYFLVEDMSGNFGYWVGQHYLLGTDPKLGPLQDNGGPTRTHALLDGSPAIDKGADYGETRDQRGARRMIGAAADIGAFESGANVFTVNSTEDTDDGSCSALAGGDCTLREAISAANAVAIEDAILFSIPPSDPGYDAATERYTINLSSALPGLADNLLIGGPGAFRLTVNRAPAAPAFRIFQVQSGIRVGISGLTVSGGSEAEGGGIQNAGFLNITNTTISGNTASEAGGGIQNVSGGTLNLTHCTVSGNTSNLNGGGISNGGTLTLTNCTISSNSASSAGGGVDNSMTLDLNSTIVAGNTAPSGQDISGAVSSGDYNLIGSLAGLSGDVPGANNLTGVDPQLGPLQDNDGPSPTHALLPSSPAIDKGKNFSGMGTDQRGFARVFNVPTIPNAAGGDDSDIGAFESNTNIFIVNTTADAFENGCSSLESGGDCTLREAILAANSTPGTEAILFDIPANDHYTIQLWRELPSLASDMTISGPGADRLTIERGGFSQFRIFSVNASVRAAISGMTISGGSGGPDLNGGGILNFGTLEISGVAVSQNTASNGGGIFNSGGVLTVTASTVSGNYGSQSGGIQNQNGTLILKGSTVSGNTGGYAGGIDNFGTANVTNSTVSGNSSYFPVAGGIRNNGTLDLYSSIVAGNSGTSPDIQGPVSSGDYNLVQSTTGLSGALPGSHNFTGVDPQLGPLQNNGGPMFTHALLFGSPALDAGNNAAGLSKDQRGLDRTVDLAEANVGDGTDIGAFEAQTAPIRNTAPSVQVGGPYSVAEGGSVDVSAIGTDPEGDPLTYDWDLDGDGVFETPGQEVTFSAATLDGPDTVTIKVRVTDTGNLSAVDETTVDVVNVAPSVDTPLVSPTPSFPGAAVNVGATFSDPGPDGPFTCTVNFGDGSGEVQGTVTGNTCNAGPHTYSTLGLHMVTVTARDKDGAVGSSSFDHTVIYNFTGFFSPVVNPPSVNVVKAIARVSITFGLGGNQGLNILPVSPDSQQIDASTKQPIGAAAPASGTLSYNKKTAKYTYTWQTNRAWAGTYRQFILRLNDQTIHTAWFSFTK